MSVASKALYLQAMCMWFEALKGGTVLRVEVTVVQGLDNREIGETITWKLTQCKLKWL